MFLRALSFIIISFLLLPWRLLAVDVRQHFVSDYEIVPHVYNGQVWQIGVYDEIYTFFAHKEGLLQFDGVRWSHIPVNSRNDVRSLAIDRDNGRVYVGSINEFGFASPGPNGALQYTCLSDSLGEERNIGNIWGIFIDNDQVYAQGDNAILKYHKGKVTTITSASKLNCSNMIDGVLYVGADDGLKYLLGKSLQPLPNTQALMGKRIRGICKYHDGLIIITAHDGVFLYQDGVLTPILTGAEAVLANGEVFTGAVNGDILALGTISDGVVISNLTTKSVQVYNKQKGLRENTVLSLSFDQCGNLWAGLDNGINLIHIDDRTTILGNDMPYGAGYAAAIVKGKLYIGTNRGLYVSDAGEEMQFSLIPALQGQVWGLADIGGQLFCMHDRGLYTVDDRSVSHLGQSIGTWDVTPFYGDSTMLWVGTYNGLYAMRRTANGWQTVDALKGLNESVANFLVTAPDEIWYNRNNTEVIKLKIDPSTLTVKSQKAYYITDMLPAVDYVHINRVGDKICFTTSGGLYKYDPAYDCIVVDKELNKRMIGDVRYNRILSKDGYVYALTPNEIVRSSVSGASSPVRLTLHPAASKPLSEGNPLLVINDSTLLLGNFAGFTIYDFGHNGVSSSHANVYGRVNRLTCADSVVYVANYSNIRNNINIPYSDNSVKIEFGIPNPHEKGVMSYRYRLNNGQWTTTTDNSKEYTNLREGKYTFTLETKMIDGSEFVDSVSFTIATPWYRSVWAYILYAVMSMAAVLLLYFLAKKLVSRRQQKIIEQKDDLIKHLESEKLQAELNHKRQEIVNLMLSVSNKNETLNALKDDIQKASTKITGNPEAKKALLAVMQRLSESTNTEDILSKVEKEFDLVHNNFITTLRRRYPDISNNEVLMCSYLKMRLSTKEIAPLLNISVRGVETMRYRIRKKFNLDREDSLTDFLNEISNSL